MNGQLSYEEFAVLSTSHSSGTHSDQFCGAAIAQATQQNKEILSEESGESVIPRLLSF
jgi:hypothetical protein